MEISNTESNSQYLRLCKLAAIVAHPARFPEKLPAFFISFLTDPGDLVLDIFAGSNTTGAAAQTADRRWLAFDVDAEYLAASVFRFSAGMDEGDAVTLFQKLSRDPEAEALVEVPQSTLFTPTE